MKEQWDDYTKEIYYQEQCCFNGYSQGFTHGMGRICQELFDKGLISAEMMEKMAEELNITMDTQDPPNFSNEYEEDGYEQGLAEGTAFIVIRLVLKNRLTMEQAADALDMQMEEFQTFFYDTLGGFEAC